MERREFTSAVMGFLRSCCRPITSCSTKMLCDDQVCRLLGVPNPGELLQIEQARVLFDVAEQGPSFIWQLAIEERSWLDAALSSLSCVLEAVGQSCVLSGDLRACLELVYEGSSHFRPLLKKYRQVITKQRSAGAAEVACQVKEVAEFEKLGGVVLPVTNIEHVGIWDCQTCARDPSRVEPL